jgi:broad specificity phosphatase PhoE
MRLYLIRHGETDYNRLQRMQGHGPVPLNTAGIDQVTRLARRLASEAKLDHIYASDLRRTVMSAEIVAEHNRVPITYDVLFRERDPGDLTERTYDEAQAFFTDLTYIPPNGEGVAAFLDRVRRAMDRLLEAEGTNRRHVALVTHGMFCRAFLQYLGRDPFEVPAWGNACLTIADYDPEKNWTIDTIACTAHLEEDDASAHATGG